MARNRSWNAALAILGIALLLPLGSCKGSDEVVPPQEITINFEVIDHMTGDIGRTLTKNGLANSSMTITTAETEISGVVSDYLSIWDPSKQEVLGSGGSGSVTFTTNNNTHYWVIRFHDGNGLKEVYDGLVAEGGRLYAGRDSTWGRKDEAGCTGSEAVWTNVFGQVNNILYTPFKLGSATTGGNQNWYGFGKEGGGDGGKDLSIRWIYVNTNIPEAQQIRTGLEELIEYLGAFNNVLGLPTQMTICDPMSNVLNEKGEAGLRFIFAYCK